ncbi:MAG TPA: hypothetical protein VJJ28_01865 [Candidatus Paceibacterota bacterium]
MCTKIHRESFKVNKNIISDSLEFMMMAYRAGQYEKFAFWRKQLDKAVEVRFNGCECSDIIL